MPDHDFAHDAAAQEARERKALALAGALASLGVGPLRARHLSPQDRRWVASCASVRPPSDETWARALELYTEATARPELCPECQEIVCDADCPLAAEMGWLTEADHHPPLRVVRTVDTHGLT